MKILITGGAGFIGSNLAQFHLEKNDEVVVIDNLITGSEENIKKLLKKKNFYFYKEDIITFSFSLLTLNQNKSNSKCAFNSFDIIYHLASPASPVQYQKYPLETLKTNSLGTLNLLEFFKNNPGGTFVLASTSEVYGDPKEHPQSETYWGNVNPVGVRSCYDESKRFAEALTITYFRQYNLDVRIGRIFNTYGPNMEKNDGRVISNFIYQALTNQPLTIFGDGNQTRSFCYVEDMVISLYLLGTTKNIAGEIINLGNPEELKIIELAKIIKSLTNSSSPIKFQQEREDDPSKRKPDINKAKKLLHWEPKIKLEDGLKKTINYFKNRFNL